MKKIILSIIMICVLSPMRAQILQLYKGDVLVKEYDATTVDKVIFKNIPIPNYKTQKLNAGDKVEGKIIVEGDTLTKGVGGTVADYVDLGIKDASGNAILWATHNLGADSKEQAGAYIAWAENGTVEEGYVEGIKSSGYDWNTLKYSNGTTDKGPFSKYVKSSLYGTIDNIVVFDSQDDAATVNWGGDWRTPTFEEWQALNNTTNFTWTWDGTNYGYKVTSNISGYKGNYIFLPAAGFRETNELKDSQVAGSYWANSIVEDKNYYANGCYFYYKYTHHVADSDNNRLYGFCIRPVYTKK